MEIGLGNSLATARGISGPSGLNPDYVKLRLHFDSDFSDSSIHDRLPTLIGSSTIDTVEKVFGDGSMKNPGLSDMISFPASSDFNMGDSIPFQLSWRMRRTSGSQAVFFAVGNYNNGYILASNGNWTAVEIGSNNAVQGSWPYSVLINTWVAYRFNHDGANNYRWYVNGVLLSIKVITGMVDASLPFVVGGRLTNTGMAGNFDEVLFEKHADLVVTTDLTYEVETTAFPDP